MAIGQLPLELEVPPWAFLSARKTPWWLEVECWSLGILSLAMLCLAPLVTPLSMAEATVGRAALEMLLSQEWVVPRCQDVPVPQLAPLQVWLVALISTVQGHVDAWSIRLPSLIAFWLTGQLLYAYCRQFMGTVGSLGAGLMFLTTVGVQMQLGSGTALPIAAFFLALALFSWHIGLLHDWPDLIQWVVPYFALTLAILSSGLFPALVFASSLTCYLILRRKEEYALTFGHLAGLLGCIGLTASWVLTYLSITGINPWWAGASPLGTANPLWSLVEHLVTFPLLVACTILLPWGLLLVVYLFADFRRHLGDARPAVQFISVCLLIPGALMWVDPRCTPSAALLLLPGITVLTAIVVQRSVESFPTSDWQFIWPTFLQGTVIVSFVGMGLTMALRGVLPEKNGPYPLGNARLVNHRHGVSLDRHHAVTRSASSSGVMGHGSHRTPDDSFDSTTHPRQSGASTVSHNPTTCHSQAAGGTDAGDQPGIHPGRRPAQIQPASAQAALARRPRDTRSPASRLLLHGKRTPKPATPLFMEAHLTPTGRSDSRISAETMAGVRPPGRFCHPCQFSGRTRCSYAANLTPIRIWHSVKGSGRQWSSLAGWQSSAGLAKFPPAAITHESPKPAGIMKMMFCEALPKTIGL